jgi:predicted Zn-dependent peptidase
MGYDLDPDFDFLTKMEDTNSEEISKVIKKYLSKPFLSIYGDKVICNKVKKIWLEEF